MAASPLSGLSNLQQRIIAGVLGGTFMVGGMLWNAWSLLFLFCSISLLGIVEFYKIIEENDEEPSLFWGITLTLIIHVLCFAYANTWIDGKFFILLAPSIMMVYIFELYRKSENPFENIAYTLLGVVYVSLPFALFYLVAISESNYRYQIVIGSFLLLWSSDSGAYFSGKAFGKTKLFERVSPKKTWEGTLGGLSLTLTLAYFLHQWYPILTLWTWFGMAIIIVVFGTLGDLVESMLKRSLQIKDSGQLIPGHGGILDRFDGILISGPFIVALIYLT